MENSVLTKYQVHVLLATLTHWRCCRERPDSTRIPGISVPVFPGTIPETEWDHPVTGAPKLVLRYPFRFLQSGSFGSGGLL